MAKQIPFSEKITDNVVLLIEELYTNDVTWVDICKKLDEIGIKCHPRSLSAYWKKLGKSYNRIIKSKIKSIIDEPQIVEFLKLNRDVYIIEDIVKLIKEKFDVSTSIASVQRICNKYNIKLDRNNYLKRQSETMKQIFANTNVRQKISRVSNDNWKNEEYIKKHQDGVQKKLKDKEYMEWKKSIQNSPEVRKKLREASARLHNDLINREKWLKKLKSKAVKNKLSKSSKEKWQNEEYQKIYKTKEFRSKISKISKERWKNKEYRLKYAEIWANRPNKISYIQELLYRYLDDLNIDYYKEGENTKIGHYVFDCLVKTSDGHKDLLIECQGDYWHSLDNAIRNDKAKFTYISRYFPEYEIMYIWEHEFYTNDGVIDRIKSKLGLLNIVIDFNFNDVIIRECSASDYRSFLDAYHYIGKGRGGKCYGAYIDDKLIACCVISPSSRNNFNLHGDFRELSRFCIHPSYHKKNFASWFISRCLKLINCKVVAYADETVGHIGTIYKAANFKFSHMVPSDYWYINANGYVMHKQTLYGKARRLKMTEAEFAKSNGYIKKFGGRKFCYVWFK